MKKYFIITSIVNILLSFLAFYLFINYLSLSASKMYSTIMDLAVLIVIVLLDILINAIIFRILNQKEKVIILIPSSLFMVFTGLLFLIK